MGRLLFTIVAAAITGGIGYFAIEFFLRKGIAIPQSLQAQGATPHNIGICSAIVLGCVGAAWAWGKGSQLR